MAAAAVHGGTPSRHDAVFASVFPPKQHTTATPEATPNIGTLASPGLPFGGFNVRDDPASLAVQFNKQWTTATRFLTLPLIFETRPRDWRPLFDQDVNTALGSIVSSLATRKQLLEWYNYEVATHFRNFVLPSLHFWDQPIAFDDAHQALTDTTTVLQRASQQYFCTTGLGAGDFGLDPDIAEFMLEAKRHFHVLILHALPRQRLQNTLTTYLYQSIKHSLVSDTRPEHCIQNDDCVCDVSVNIDVLEQLKDIGLGGALGERAFAHAVHALLQGPAVERRCFSVDWHGQTSCVERLRRWVQQRLVPALEIGVAALAGRDTMMLPTDNFIYAALTHFGRQRVAALFDYVSTWPASEGALLDIKGYLHVNGASEKAHLCASFSEQIQRRLFHAGASTTEILSVYINVIHVFRLLDSRGVLLEKVAIPIRSYLRGREDTVSTIAASFLASPEDVEAGDYDDKVCTAVTAASYESVQRYDDHGNGSDLHWQDKNWMPDPIDAGPDYKSSKSDSILAYVIGLFEPDDFVKAFSTALGLQMLRTKDRTYSAERHAIAVLEEHLEAGLLQHAEVMLKDMQDSATLNRRVNPSDEEIPPSVPPTPKELQNAIPDDGITLNSLYERFKTRVDSTQFQADLRLVANKRDDLYFPKRTRLPAERTKEIASPEGVKSKIEFETQVLSSYFWPQLRDGDFRVPQSIAKHKEKYEQAFSRISAQRRLEWRPALDMTTLTLMLEDRDVEAVDVEVWKTNVIDAFATERHDDSDIPPIEYDEDEGISVASLADALEMPEDFVQTGISYWMTKRVLYEKSTGKYAVLERLDMDVPEIEEPSQLDIEQEAGALMSQQAMLRQNASTFQIFIEQMLRNSGAKEIGGMMGITSIMKMVMPSFTYGDDEVRWLLQDMESRGDVVRKGESWAVVK
ncbi:Putative cullin, anaphase-promoting complex subunit 2 [Septoria linicola]|uniref:Cullin, anaphase-promoting complex subunit 2 n=1 Tax=Septoria linicola TaxID=215465 RepID=A0A9Q9B7Z9_9PEZI|nr:putative cullin, anaphase-promoting complex subunit 2 [Septoria linicola]USW59083.1 Putative cullin, anaphase-promoting complex subunit 2 [Septoria linicola]